MNRAIVVPYQHALGGARALYSIRDDAGVIAEESIEAGHLVPIVNPTPDQLKKSPTPMERVVDADAIAAELAAALRAHHVERVEIEAARGTGVAAVRSRDIARALVALLSDIDVVTVDTAMPIPPPHIPRAALATSAELAKVEAETALEIDASPESGLGRAPVAKAGPRIAGIDPGSHWIACFVAETAADGPRFVSSRTFEIGRLIPLATPKTIQRKDGSTFTRTHRREITDADIGAMLRDVVAWLAALNVDRVVVERATFFHAGASADSARAAQLARAQWIGGEIAGALRFAMSSEETPIGAVESVSSRVWRGVASRRAATWRDGVVGAFAAWPKSIDAHAVDAAGCVLWGVAKPATKVKRDPSAPKVKRVRNRSSADAHAARKAKLAKVRADAGCTCSPRRHVRTCSLYRPPVYKDRTPP